MKINLHLFPCSPSSLLALTTAAAFLVSSGRVEAAPEPPPSFTALFNGKDLTGWRGGDTFDHRKVLAWTEEERKGELGPWTEDMKKYWKAENGEMVNDGHGKYATTEKEYGDFELLVEYNMAANGDSGIYLRNVPQVQIWDHNQPDPGD